MKLRVKEHFRSSGRRGFTLVELLSVLAIIGVLASIAIPNMLKFVYRAKRSEAYIHLKAIYKAQVSYYVENKRYANTFDEITFEIPGALAIDPQTIQAKHYTYTVSAIDVGGQPGGNFSAVATANLDPSDAILDILIVESGLILLE